jgi:hypothetical protein
MSAIFDHHCLVLVALHERQRLGEQAGLCGGVAAWGIRHWRGVPVLIAHRRQKVRRCLAPIRPGFNNSFKHCASRPETEQPYLQFRRIGFQDFRKLLSVA